MNTCAYRMEQKSHLTCNKAAFCILRIENLLYENPLTGVI